MRRILKIIIIVYSLLFIAGCTPVGYIVGGIATVFVASEGIKKAKKEKARKLVQKREEKEEQAARFREEVGRKEEAKRLEQARLRKEEAIKKEVSVFLANVEYRLKGANWGRETLPELLEKTLYLDREFLSLEIRQRLNLAVGLYAYLAGDKQQAETKFKKAKELGVKNPRMIVPKVWTPGSIEAFDAS